MSVTFVADIDDRDDRPSLNLANSNARALLQAMGLDSEELYGECSIADARRAIMRARNTDVSDFTRAEEIVHGKPREDAEGVIQLRPVRMVSFGLDVHGLNDRIDRFADMVEEGARKGARGIFWG